MIRPGQLESQINKARILESLNNRPGQLDSLN